MPEIVSILVKLHIILVDFSEKNNTTQMQLKTFNIQIFYYAIFFFNKHFLATLQLKRSNRNRTYKCSGHEPDWLPITVLHRFIV